MRRDGFEEGRKGGRRGKGEGGELGCRSRVIGNRSSFVP